MKDSKLYNHLDSLNVLENGTAKDIEMAKKEYRRQYKAMWRKNKRSESKSITVSFTPKEYITVSAGAKKHNTNPTHYVYSTALAYGRQNTLSMDKETIGFIRESLLRNFNSINDLAEDSHLSKETEHQLIQRLQEIEQIIMSRLTSPLLLKDAIRDALRRDNGFKETLLQLLNEK